jgi:phosphatidylserine/phosphatidylglycerophosphate/cardiolipin synthase-like enzyme
MRQWLKMRKSTGITLLALLAILANACLAGLPAPVPQPTLPAAIATASETASSTAPATAVATASATAETVPTWLQVYFTNPNPPDQVENGIDRVAVQAVDHATQTVEVASFDFTLPGFTDALVNAANRGVKVRVVLDEVNGSHTLKASESPTGKAFDALKTLSSANIKVVNGGRSNGLMHDKMIIIDGTTLFMGSWNMSYNDTFRNNNNLLVIKDPQLIANYQAKFDELYVDKRFGTKAVVQALKPELTLDGVQVENYFSPPDHVMDKLIAYVRAARSSVRFMIFTYTDAALAAAMIERLNAGVNVEGVIEARDAEHGVLPSLFCAKLPVKTDGNKYTMHHKVIIIDDNTVITGSFNFTVTADKANDDNILVIHSPAVAALYTQEFDRVYGIGKIPNPADIDCTNIK